MTKGIDRRVLLQAAAALSATTLGVDCLAFGDSNAFHPRVLVDDRKLNLDDVVKTGAERWAWELVRRTSAPARVSVAKVEAAEQKLVEEPFLIWTGTKAGRPLSPRGRRRLESYFRLGGILVVDDLARRKTRPFLARTSDIRSYGWIIVV